MSKEMTKKTTTKKAAPRKRTSRAKKTEAPVELSADSRELTDSEIRQRAYEIYRRGQNPSDPTADWFQAVQELRSEAGA
jgi:hypothetical protein